MSKHHFWVFGQRSNGEWKLPASEKRYIQKVVRLGQGEPFTLFDGQGFTAKAQYSASGLEIIQEGPAAPKIRGTRLFVGDFKLFDECIPELVELGVEKVYLCPTQKAQVTKRKESSLERWYRLLIAAAKQSKRPWLMEIEYCPTFKEWVTKMQDEDKRRGILFEKNAPLLGKNAVFEESAPWFVMGPESGFAEQEIEVLESHVGQKCSLSAFTLRTQTAVRVAAAFGILNQVHSA